MNIFYLDKDPVQAAAWMVDKHIVKMPTESAQMLSTAHRLLDGSPSVFEYESEGKLKRKKIWLMDGEAMGFTEAGRPTYVKSSGVTLYMPTHANHPSNSWTRAGREQYLFHVRMLRAMLDEYTLRYGKRHKVEQLMEFFQTPPKNIPDVEWTEPPLAMPDKYKTDDHVESYRRFYVGEKASFARWKTGTTPPWWPY